MATFTGWYQKTNILIFPSLLTFLKGQHYVSVDETDIISVVKGLEKNANVSELMDMTDRAQGFAHR